MLIRLSPNEMLSAGEVGLRHYIKARFKNLNDRIGAKPEDQMKGALLGYFAEIAVSKALGVYWPMDLNGFKNADLPNNIQVRSTTYMTGKLVLHDVDADDHYYVLVVGDAPDLKMAGYIRGAEGKKKEFWDSSQRHPAYFVPQSALSPFQKEALIQ